MAGAEKPSDSRRRQRWQRKTSLLACVCASRGT